MGCWISHDFCRFSVFFETLNFRQVPQIIWNNIVLELNLKLILQGDFFTGRPLSCYPTSVGEKWMSFLRVAWCCFTPKQTPVWGRNKILDKIWITRKKNVSKLETTPNKLLFVQKQSPQLLRWWLLRTSFFGFPQSFPQFRKIPFITKRFPSPSNNPLRRLVGRPWLRFPKAMSRQLHVQNSNL